MEKNKKRYFRKSEPSIKELYIQLSNSIKSNIKTIRSSPSTHLKTFVAGGLSVIIGLIINDAINDKYTIVEYPTQSSAIETAVSDLDRSLFSNKVVVITNDGNVEIPLSDLTISSVSFKESDIKKHSTLYRLSNTSPLKNSFHKTKFLLDESEYVISNSVEDKDGYVTVITSDGKSGKLLKKDLEKVMEINLEKDKPKNNHKKGYDYTSVNGEVVGIDFTTASVTNANLNSLFTNDLNLKPIGNIDNPQIDYTFLRTTSYAWGSKHGISDVLTGKKTENQIIKEVIERARLCLENDRPYGLYLYSTCVNAKEAEEEARFLKKLLDQLQKETGTLPLLPIAIDVESAGGNANRQVKAAKQNKDSVSLAKAHLFNELIKAYPDLDYMLYTERNACEQEVLKFFDVETIVDNVKGIDQMDVWWVSAMNKGSNAENLHAASAKRFEKESNGKARIVMKQIALDVLPGIDINVADEEWIKEYFEKYYDWIKDYKPEETYTKSDSLTLTSGYITQTSTTLYNYNGSRATGTLEEGVQLLGKSTPDKNGFVSVVTRDGRKGKVKLANLSQVENKTKPAITTSTSKNKDDDQELYI